MQQNQYMKNTDHDLKKPNIENMHYASDSALNLSMDSSFEQSPSPISINPSTPIKSSYYSNIQRPLLSRDSSSIPEFSDDSDDEIEDWAILNNLKKGTKDLEPLLNKSDRSILSPYDQNKLNKARNMRFNALSVKRGSIVNLENLNASTIFIDVNDSSNLFMLQPKGKFLETMGYIDNQNICHFDFEEVLYLVERGSCMAKFYDKNDKLKNNLLNDMPPLSLQAVYSVLIKNDEQLNQYLVYSILKRDGYIINRNEEFDGKVINPKNNRIDHSKIFENLKMSRWIRFLSKVTDFFKIQFPFKLSFSYFNIYTYLHSKILKQSLPKLNNNNNYNKKIKDHKISFNVWKPSPNFKKKNPPSPDYQISIFKATQRLPKYLEIKSLLERSYCNTETYKPKPKVKQRKIKEQPQIDKQNLKDPKILENSWDYSKGIDMSNLKYDPLRITLAIIDNATINFITLSHCSFVSEGPVWRDHWVTWKPPKKKNRHSNNKNNRNNKKKLTIQTPNDGNTESLLNEHNISKVNCNISSNPNPPKSAHF